jgi:hypothetical protein
MAGFCRKQLKTHKVIESLADDSVVSTSVKGDLNNSVDQLPLLQQGSKDVSSHQSEKQVLSESDDHESNESFILPEGNNMFIFVLCSAVY